MAMQAHRAAAAAALQKQQQQQIQPPQMNVIKNRGRPQTITKPSPGGTVLRTNQAMPSQMPAGGIFLPNNFSINNAAQYIQVIDESRLVATYSMPYKLAERRSAQTAKLCT